MQVSAAFAGFVAARETQESDAAQENPLRDALADTLEGLYAASEDLSAVAPLYVLLDSGTLPPEAARTLEAALWRLSEAQATLDAITKNAARTLADVEEG